MELLKKIKQQENFLISTRRKLHRIPELGLDTYQTCNAIEQILMENQIPYQKLLNGSAIMATIDSGKAGKCLAIRSDMDALEIKEKTGLPFQSENGYMHACGHDCHMADSLTSLLVLNSMKEHFFGSVKFLFQPGEEYPGGAELMISEGVLENPKVDAIIGHHVGGLFPEIPTGKIGIKSGKLMASMDKFEIEVQGCGGHGSMPENTRDPIVCLVDIFQAINRIKSREIEPSQQCVISICKMEAGTSQNIIPSTGLLEGTVRTFDHPLREYIRDRIGEISTYYAKANRCEVTYRYEWKYPYVKNDGKMTSLLKKSALKILPEESVHDIQTCSMAGDDMAYYLEKVPGTYFMLSNLKTDEKGKTYPNHHAKFDVDETQLYKAVAVIVQFALDFLSEK